MEETCCRYIGVGMKNKSHVEGMGGKKSKGPKCSIDSETFPLALHLKPGATYCKAMHSRRSPLCRLVSLDMWWQMGNGASQHRLYPMQNEESCSKLTFPREGNASV